MLLEVPQLPGKFQQMMRVRLKGWRRFNVRLTVFLITGAENSHQHHHRPGRLGDARALDVRFAFVWGLLAFALNYIRILVQSSRQSPLSLRYWCLRLLRSVAGAGGISAD